LADFARDVNNGRELAVVSRGTQMTTVATEAAGAWVAVGLGCDSQAAVEEIRALLQQCLAEAMIGLDRIRCLATVELKADEAGLLALADELRLPLTLFSVASLEAETPRLVHPSEAVFRAVGCHGVAEAAALAATGPEGRLLLPKRRSARATCALALSPAMRNTLTPH
jgi:cobalt-precorrin 5A hydrolase/precorrin-3B C17-methyltransferase